MRALIILSAGSWGVGRYTLQQTGLYIVDGKLIGAIEDDMQLMATYNDATEKRFMDL